MNLRKVAFSIAILIAIGYNFQITPMLQNDTPFTINKAGLEEVIKKLFTRIQYFIPSKLNELGIRKVSNYKILINTAIQKALAEADISKALENPTPEQITALTEQLKRIFTNLIPELYTDPAELNWCACPNAPEYMRIALVVDIVNDARKERDPNNRIVYTSIASGEMLLDYLIVSELIHYGFKNIQVNFIELGLLDIPDIQAFINQAEVALKKQRDLYAQQGSTNRLPETEYNTAWQRAYQQETHAQNLLNNALNFRSYLLTFERKLKEKANPKQAEIEINHYDHAGDYRARAKQYAFERTDILILVDPSSGIYPLKNSIGAQAFAVQYEDESAPASEDFFNEMADSFIVFIPRTSVQDIKLYSNIDFDSLSYDDPLRNLYTSISALIYETQDVAAIRQTLTQPFDYTSFMIHKVAQKIVPPAINQQTEDINPYTQDETLKVYWISDAYLVLQDLVRDCLSNIDTAALYDIAYSTKERKEPLLQRLNAREYQTKDVITPNIGAALEEVDYKLISPSPEARIQKKIKSPEDIAELRRKRQEMKATKALMDVKLKDIERKEREMKEIRALQEKQDQE